MEHEWIDNKGDVWSVDECEDCEGAVVRHYQSKRPINWDKIPESARRAGMEIMRRVKDREEAEPDHLIDIPPDMLPTIIAALQRRLDSLTHQEPHHAP